MKNIEIIMFNVTTKCMFYHPFPSLPFKYTDVFTPFKKKLDWLPRDVITNYIMLGGLKRQTFIPLCFWILEAFD